MPGNALPAFDSRDHDRRRDREFRDHLHWRIVTDTLFVIGSRLAFELEGSWLRELVEESTALLAGKPDAHSCVEIGMGLWGLLGVRRRGCDSELHVQCCNHHR